MLVKQYYLNERTITRTYLVEILQCYSNILVDPIQKSVINENRDNEKNKTIVFDFCTIEGYCYELP